MTNIDNLKKDIQGHGHWEIRFYPLDVLDGQLGSPGLCKSILKEAKVSLRGWSFPSALEPTIASQNKSDFYILDDCCEGYTNFDIEKEVFRFYQTGLFVDYLAFWEDWSDWHYGFNSRTNMRAGNGKFEKIINVIGVIYAVTEFFEFIKRVVSKTSIFDNGVHIQIVLRQCNKRALVVLDTNRAPLLGDYISLSEKITGFDSDVSKEDIIAKSRDLSLETTRNIFLKFQWENVPIDAFRLDQEKLLDGHI